MKNAKITTIGEIEEFLVKLAHANIEIPKNLSLGLTVKEEGEFRLDFISKFNQPPNNCVTNKVMTQYGTININLIEE